MVVSFRPFDSKNPNFRRVDVREWFSLFSRKIIRIVYRCLERQSEKKKHKQVCLNGSVRRKVNMKYMCCSNSQCPKFKHTEIFYCLYNIQCNLLSPHDTFEFLSLFRDGHNIFSVLRIK